MKHTTLSLKLSILLAVAAPLLSAVAFSQTAMFSVKELVNLPGETQANASGINNSGDVVGAVSGSSQCPTGCAVIWINGTPSLLGAVTGAIRTLPVSINSFGQVVGTAYGATLGYQAVIWNDGTPSLLLAGAYSSSSNAAFINDTGLVVGDAEVSAIAWNGGTETALGLVSGLTTAAAYGANDNGLIVGTSCCDHGSGRATVWHGASPRLLPQVSSGSGSDDAFAVNNSGLVVGQGSTGTGNHALAWINGVVTDLGALVQQSSAAAVNNHGIIVGESDSLGNGYVHAVLWSHIGAPIQDLNKLISATAAAEIILTGATAINDNCTIVATGFTRKTKLYQALLLILNDPSKCASGL